jgi:hypothetical protein
MRQVTAAELLTVWEQGREESVSRRALRLLRAILPDRNENELADLPIGQRDGFLLDLREQVFGSQLVCVCNCPFCGERLEIEFQAGDIRAVPDGAFVLPLTCTVEGIDLCFRLPTTRDLLAVEALTDPADIQRELRARCLLSAQRKGDAADIGALPPAALEGMEAQIARCDPQAEIRLPLVCAACGQSWKELFDIVVFLWTEIEAWARRTLREIHLLASAYGWREADILTLSAWRRQHYLEMVGS